MSIQFSDHFLTSIDKSNIELAKKLLGIFNDAFVAIEDQQGKTVIGFKIWDKVSVTTNTYVKRFIVDGDIPYLSRKIIRECDLSAFDRASVEDELRITIEKYALADFLNTVIDNFNRVDIPVKNEIQQTFVISPQDAKLVINDEVRVLINGVFTGLFTKGESLTITVSKDGYHAIDRVITASNNTEKITLEPIDYHLHLAVVPHDAEVHLYKGALSTLPDYVHGNTSLTDEIPPHSLSDDLFTPDTSEEIPLIETQDMLFAKLQHGTYTVRAKKRLYDRYQETFTIDSPAFKVINLEPKFVHVDLTMDPIYDNALTSINGKSVELPYSFDMDIGESALIESRLGDLVYRNYIIANEADVKNGLEYNITFIKKYTLDIAVDKPCQIYINNELQGTPYYSGEFTQGSRVDVRIESERYVPITETFYMARDIQKMYTLEELLPLHDCTIAVTPKDAFVTINGKAVVNPFNGQFPEGSSITVKATALNYISYNEVIVFNDAVTREIVLEQYELFKPTVRITCNVAEAVCFINDQEMDLPASITVEQGSRLKVNIRAEGYKDHNEIIVVRNQDITRDIVLTEITQDELQDLVNITINVNRINSLVFLNNRQLDGEVIQSEAGEITNYLFKTKVPRGTYCQLQVTNPGYRPYFETFVPNVDFERNVILTKEPHYNLYRVNIFCRTSGAILEVNGKKVSSPYVHDLLEGTKLSVKCYADFFTTFEYNAIITKDIILPIELNPEVSNE